MAAVGIVVHLSAVTRIFSGVSDFWNRGTKNLKVVYLQTDPKQAVCFQVFSREYFR